MNWAYLIIIGMLIIAIYNLNKTNQQYEALIYVQDEIITQYRAKFGDIEIKLADWTRGE